jgi:hypothetical protein
VFPITSSAKVDPAGENYFRESKEYIMKLEIRSHFTCVDEVYPLAVREAQASVIHLIYKDVLTALYDIRQAAFSGEFKRVDEACNRLKKRILEGDE